MRIIINSLRQFIASFRMLLIFTVVLGVAYPLVILAVAQVPGLKSRADGSTISQNGKVVGSKLIGQAFTDADGAPLVQYFQSRPSAAGDGYDPTASSASNLGPESIVDTLPDPSVKDDTGTQSLLTQVCTRSLAVGELEGVSGARPYCTTDGVGAVLAVFYAGPGYTGQITRVVSINQTAPAKPFIGTYNGVAVEVATFGADYSLGQIVPIRGDAPADPEVPPDAVTASGSGLDPEISPAYARLQEARVAKERGVSVDQVKSIVATYQKGRDLGFIGEARVNVVQLNLALDKAFPYKKAAN
ncbi:MAG: potassium-transporting ATPase subunit [Pseudonocardiales bacterium]|nr:potassium-transporting ATPase subunit [Pseudonocardiales bacterium]